MKKKTFNLRSTTAAQRDSGVVDEVAAWSADLPDQMIQCRDFGHSWRAWSATYTEDNSIARALRCTRCRTERIEHLSMSGAKLTGRYRYPDGYQVPAGVGRLDGDSRNALRLQSTMRLVIRANTKKVS